MQYNPLENAIDNLTKEGYLFSNLDLEAFKDLFTTYVDTEDQVEHKEALQKMEELTKSYGFEGDTGSFVDLIGMPITTIEINCMGEF